MVSTHCMAVYSCSRHHKMHLFALLPAHMGCAWKKWVTLGNLVSTGAVDLRAVREEEQEAARENLTSEQKQKKDSEGRTEFSLMGPGYQC